MCHSDGSILEAFYEWWIIAFFYGMCNLYIFALAYLSWPQEVKFKEYEINIGGDSVADVAPGGT